MIIHADFIRIAVRAATGQADQPLACNGAEASVVLHRHGNGSVTGNGKRVGILGEFTRISNGFTGCIVDITAGLLFCQCYIETGAVIYLIGISGITVNIRNIVVGQVIYMGITVKAAVYSPTAVRWGCAAEISQDHAAFHICGRQTCCIIIGGGIEGAVKNTIGNRTARLLANDRSGMRIIIFSGSRSRCLNCRIAVRDSSAIDCDHACFCIGLALAISIDKTNAAAGCNGSFVAGTQ